MPAGDSTDLTQLLSDWRAGDEDAGRVLVTAVHKQLRQLAAACLRNETDASSLQPTALVNELCVSLFSRKPLDCENRLHFMHIAARQMRNIVIDDARSRKNLKRGGAVHKLALDEALGQTIVIDDRLTDLNEALDRLEAMDSRSAKVVELRFFAGMTEPEIASLLNISVPTVKRDWEFARSWLLAQIEPG